MRLQIPDFGSGIERAGVCAAAMTLLCATAQAAGTWSPAGDLSNARVLHTASLLPNGKILVAGGWNGSNVLASAQLYDPGSNTWNAAGSLAVARGWHSATLLPNGKVLVVGGSSDSAGLASAELYDPGTDTWSAAGSMGTEHNTHTATLLSNGKVLVAGGGGTSSEVYDPGTNTWSAVGSLTSGRHSHTATLLPNGKVLVVGGVDPGNFVLGSAELYDPGTNTWSAAAGLATARYAHRATLLPNGKVLVVGGVDPGNVNLASAELYDPGANTWGSADSLATGRHSFSAALLPNGKYIVVGGWRDGTGPLASAEVYDAGTNTWTAMGNLATSRQASTATVLPDGRLLVAAGSQGGAATLTSAELFDYAAGDASWSATGSLGTARSGNTATPLANGKVLVAGGVNGGTYLASAELYDPGSGTWSNAGSFANVRGNHTATLLPDTNVLIAGGENGSISFASAQLYSPAINTWSAAGNLATARTRHTATLLPNGKVLVAGGKDSSDAFLASAEVYDPGTNVWSGAGSLGTGRESHRATLLSNGMVLIVGGQNGGGLLASAELYDPGTNTWRAAGSLATARIWHTATLLSTGKVLVAAGWNGDCLTSAELYDPGANTWSAAGGLVVKRHGSQAVLLPSGKVLVAAGWNANGYVATAAAQIYDPATNTWSAVGNLATARGAHTATLLPSGQVLVAGGSQDGGSQIASAELFNPGAAFQDSWRPVINTATSPLSLGSGLTLSGTGFKGISEASGGGCQSSATNYPLVQLRSLVNEQTAFLLPDPANNWSDTGFTSKPVTGFPPGHAAVTVFTNGIPSVSKTILIADGAPTITSATTASGTYGVVFSYTITASGNPTSYNATGLPAWASVNTSTGAITGTPNAAGQTDITISATNATGTGQANLRITIAKATPVITWANPAGITYPAALSGTELNASCGIAGSFAYTPASGTVLNAGASQRLALQFTPTDAANYTSATAEVTIAVAKGTPVVTWANPADITYPAALSGTQLNATANTVGSFAYTPASGTVLNAGASQTLSVQFTPQDTGNWNTPAAKTAAITVLKGTPVISWATPADVVIPATLGASQLNATANVAGSFAYTPASGTELAAGQGQTLSVTFTPADTANYNSASASVTINVLPGITSLSASPNPAEPGQTVSFSAGGAAGQTITWDFGDGSARVTGATATHAYGTAGTYTVRVSFSTGAGESVQTLTVEVSTVNSRVIGNFVIAPNPADVGQEITFTATANANAGGLRTFTWNFGDGSQLSAAASAGSPVSVKYRYAQAGNYPVQLTARDQNEQLIGSTSQTAFITAAGTAHDTGAIGQQAQNKLNGLTIRVADKVRSIVALDIDVNALNRAAFEVGTDFGATSRAAVKGTRPVHEYEQSGVYVATTRAFDVDTGSEQGKMRKTIAISRDDAGENALVEALPQIRTVTVSAIKGKFQFGDTLQDAVAFAGRVELPAGFDVRKEHQLTVAIGNIVDTVTITNKGAAASQGNNFTIAKLKMKYPKLPKGTYKTTGGKTAGISLTLSTTNMSAKGFDTEGIVAPSLLPADEAGAKAVARSIQVAVLLDGVAYDVLTPVQYKPGKAGQIAGRGAQ
jgi:N-acetylneuraminic acid mutarotase/PKD repeat protein